MCGQYYVEEDYIERMMWIYPHLKKPLGDPPTGTMKPSLQAPVILSHQNVKTLVPMIWGFPALKGKGLHINARSETVLEKRTFKRSLQYNRCALPAHSYYEWDISHNKITFSRKDKELLYFAGIYRTYADTQRFVILTTRANPSVASVHHRMPLILRNTTDIEQWLSNSVDYPKLLDIIPDPLEMTYRAKQIGILDLGDQ